ncbi:MAG: hypothetical protein LBU23_09005 [Planctomycetota bacterium]|jgi:hypothetical protein|nr:hypothetical protein [Planctomycetota bacterium]
MRDRLETEGEGYFPRGRPGAAAWIAVGAAAFALFVLGGFVKTYRQLETLREESRREIRELRAHIEALRGQTAVVPRQPGRRRPTLPGAPGKWMSSLREAPLELPAPPPPAPAGRDRVIASSLPPAVEAGRAGLGYELGRKSAPPPEIGAGRLQVISASRKRLMAEGGRNLGMAAGMRLELSRDGRWFGDLRITDVYDGMVACEILHAASPPRPGDTVRLP